MSTAGSWCLISILYGYSRIFFFKILCNDAYKRPNSWERFRRDFFGFCPTESITASTLSGHLAIKSTSCQILDFLPSCWFCLLTLWPEIWVPNDKFAFLQLIFKLKLSGKFCLHRFEWFCLLINDTKYFFLYCPRFLWSKVGSCYNHYHYNIVPPAWVSLTHPFHSSLSSIAFGSSCRLHPESVQSCCT